MHDIRSRREAGRLKCASSKPETTIRAEKNSVSLCEFKFQKNLHKDNDFSESVQGLNQLKQTRCLYLHSD